jgi:hypothetical protein
MKLKVDKIIQIKRFLRNDLNIIDKEKLHIFFSYFSIFLLGIAYLFSPDEIVFTDDCSKKFYEFILVCLISFSSIIPIYYEFDVRGKKAFRAYLPGGKAGGTLLIFIPCFIYSSYVFLVILIKKCNLLLLKESIFLFFLSIIGIIIYILTIYLLVGFLIKLLNRIFKKDKEIE